MTYSALKHFNGLAGDYVETEMASGEKEASTCETTSTSLVLTSDGRRPSHAVTKTTSVRPTSMTVGKQPRRENTNITKTSHNVPSVEKRKQKVITAADKKMSSKKVDALAVETNRSVIVSKRMAGQSTGTKSSPKHEIKDSHDVRKHSSRRVQQTCSNRSSSGSGSSRESTPDVTDSPSVSATSQHKVPLPKCKHSCKNAEMTKTTTKVNRVSERKNELGKIENVPHSTKPRGHDKTIVKTRVNTTTQSSMTSGKSDCDTLKSNSNVTVGESPGAVDDTSEPIAPNTSMKSNLHNIKSSNAVDDTSVSTVETSMKSNSHNIESIDAIDDISASIDDTAASELSSAMLETRGSPDGTSDDTESEMELNQPSLSPSDADRTNHHTCENANLSQSDSWRTNVNICENTNINAMCDKSPKLAEKVSMNKQIKAQRLSNDRLHMSCSKPVIKSIPKPSVCKSKTNISTSKSSKLVPGKTDTTKTKSKPTESRPRRYAASTSASRSRSRSRSSTPGSEMIVERSRGHLRDTCTRRMNNTNGKTSDKAAHNANNDTIASKQTAEQNSLNDLEPVQRTLSPRSCCLSGGAPSNDAMTYLESNKTRSEAVEISSNAQLIKSKLNSRIAKPVSRNRHQAVTLSPSLKRPEKQRAKNAIVEPSERKTLLLVERKSSSSLQTRPMQNNMSLTSAKSSIKPTSPTLYPRVSNNVRDKLVTLGKRSKDTVSRSEKCQAAVQQQTSKETTRMTPTPTSHSASRPETPCSTNASLSRSVSDEKDNELSCDRLDIHEANAETIALNPKRDTMVARSRTRSAAPGSHESTVHSNEDTELDIRNEHTHKDKENKMKTLTPSPKLQSRAMGKTHPKTKSNDMSGTQTRDGKGENAATKSKSSANHVTTTAQRPVSKLKYAIRTVSENTKLNKESLRKLSIDNSRHKANQTLQVSSKMDKDTCLRPQSHPKSRSSTPDTTVSDASSDKASDVATGSTNATSGTVRDSATKNKELKDSKTKSNIMARNAVSKWQRTVSQKTGTFTPKHETSESKEALSRKTIRNDQLIMKPNVKSRSIAQQTPSVSLDSEMDPRTNTCQKEPDTVRHVSVTAKIAIKTHAKTTSSSAQSNRVSSSIKTRDISKTSKDNQLKKTISTKEALSIKSAARKVMASNKGTSLSPTTLCKQSKSKVPLIKTNVGSGGLVPTKNGPNESDGNNNKRNLTKRPVYISKQEKARAGESARAGGNRHQSKSSIPLISPVLDPPRCVGQIFGESVMRKEAGVSPDEISILPGVLPTLHSRNEANEANESLLPNINNHSGNCYKCDNGICTEAQCSHGNSVIVTERTQITMDYSDTGQCAQIEDVTRTGSEIAEHSSSLDGLSNTADDISVSSVNDVDNIQSDTIGELSNFSENIERSDMNIRSVNTPDLMDSADYSNSLHGANKTVYDIRSNFMLESSECCTSDMIGAASLQGDQSSWNNECENKTELSGDHGNSFIDPTSEVSSNCLSVDSKTACCLRDLHKQTGDSTQGCEQRELCSRCKHSSVPDDDSALKDRATRTSKQWNIDGVLDQCLGLACPNREIGRNRELINGTEDASGSLLHSRDLEYKYASTGKDIGIGIDRNNGVPSLMDQCNANVECRKNICSDGAEEFSQAGSSHQTDRDEVVSNQNKLDTRSDFRTCSDRDRSYGFNNINNSRKDAALYSDDAADFNCELDKKSEIFTYDRQDYVAAGAKKVPIRSGRDALRSDDVKCGNGDFICAVEGTGARSDWNIDGCDSNDNKIQDRTSLSRHVGTLRNDTPHSLSTTIDFSTATADKDVGLKCRTHVADSTREKTCICTHTHTAIDAETTVQEDENMDLHNKPDSDWTKCTPQTEQDNAPLPHVGAELQGVSDLSENVTQICDIIAEQNTRIKTNCQDDNRTAAGVPTLKQLCISKQELVGIGCSVDGDISSNSDTTNGKENVQSGLQVLPNDQDLNWEDGFDTGHDTEFQSALTATSSSTSDPQENENHQPKALQAISNPVQFVNHEDVISTGEDVKAGPDVDTTDQQNNSCHYDDEPTATGINGHEKAGDNTIDIQDSVPLPTDHADTQVSEIFETAGPDQITCTEINTGINLDLQTTCTETTACTEVNTPSEHNTCLELNSNTEIHSCTELNTASEQAACMATNTCTQLVTDSYEQAEPLSLQNAHSNNVICNEEPHSDNDEASRNSTGSNSDHCVPSSSHTTQSSDKERPSRNRAGSNSSHSVPSSSHKVPSSLSHIKPSSSNNDSDSICKKTGEVLHPSVSTSSSYSRTMEDKLIISSTPITDRYLSSTACDSSPIYQSEKLTNQQYLHTHTGESINKQVHHDIGTGNNSYNEENNLLPGRQHNINTSADPIYGPRSKPDVNSVSKHLMSTIPTNPNEPRDPGMLGVHNSACCCGTTDAGTLPCLNSVMCKDYQHVTCSITNNAPCVSPVEIRSGQKCTDGLNLSGQECGLLSTDGSCMDPDNTRHSDRAECTAKHAGLSVAKFNSVCSMCNVKILDNSGSISSAGVKSVDTVHDITLCKECSSCASSQANVVAANSTESCCAVENSTVYFGEQGSANNTENKLCTESPSSVGSKLEIRGHINRAPVSEYILSTVFDGEGDTRPSLVPPRDSARAASEQKYSVDLNSATIKMMSGKESLKIYNRSTYQDGGVDKSQGLSAARITTQKSSCNHQVFSVNSSKPQDFIHRYGELKNSSSPEKCLTYRDELDTRKTCSQTRNNRSNSGNNRDDDINVKLDLHNSKDLSNTRAYQPDNPSTVGDLHGHCRLQTCHRSTCAAIGNNGDGTISNLAKINSNLNIANTDLNTPQNTEGYCEHSRSLIHDSARDSFNSGTPSTDKKTVQRSRSQDETNRERNNESAEYRVPIRGQCETSGVICTPVLTRTCTSLTDLTNDRPSFVKNNQQRKYHSDLSQPGANISGNGINLNKKTTNSATNLVLSDLPGFLPSFINTGEGVDARTVTKRSSVISNCESCISDLSDKFVDAIEDLESVAELDHDQTTVTSDVQQDVPTTCKDVNVTDGRSDQSSNVPQSQKRLTHEPSIDNFHDAVEHLDDDYLTCTRTGPGHVSELYTDEHEETLSQDSLCSTDCSGYSETSFDYFSEWDDFDNDLENIEQYDTDMDKVGDTKATTIVQNTLENNTSTTTSIRRTRTVLKDNAYLKAISSSGRTVKCSHIPTSILRSKDEAAQQAIRRAGIKTGNGAASQALDVDSFRGEGNPCQGAQSANTGHSSVASTSNTGSSETSVSVTQTSTSTEETNGTTGSSCTIASMNHVTESKHKHTRCSRTVKEQSTAEGTIVYRENHSMVNTKIETALIRRTQRRRRRQVERQIEHLHHNDSTKISENSITEVHVTTDNSCDTDSSRCDDAIEAHDKEHSADTSDVCSDLDKAPLVSTQASSDETDGTTDHHTNIQISTSNTVSQNDTKPEITEKPVERLADNAMVSSNTRTLDVGGISIDPINTGSKNVTTDNFTSIGLAKGGENKTTSSDIKISQNADVESDIVTKIVSVDVNDNKSHLQPPSIIKLNDEIDDIEFMDAEDDTPSAFNHEIKPESKQEEVNDSGEAVPSQTVSFTFTYDAALNNTEAVKFEAVSKEIEAQCYDVATTSCEQDVERCHIQSLQPNQSIPTVSDVKEICTDNPKCVVLEVQVISPPDDTKTYTDNADPTGDKLEQKCSNIDSRTDEPHQDIKPITDITTIVPDGDTLERTSSNVDSKTDVQHQNSKPDADIAVTVPESDTQTEICEESNISVARALAMERQKMLSVPDTTDKKEFIESRRSGRRATIETCTDIETQAIAEESSNELKVPHYATLKKSKSFKAERTEVTGDENGDFDSLHNKKVSDICMGFMTKTRTAVQKGKQLETIESPRPSRKLMKWVNDHGKWSRKPVEEGRGQSSWPNTPTRFRSPECQTRTENMSSSAFEDTSISFTDHNVDYKTKPTTTVGKPKPATPVKAPKPVDVSSSSQRSLLISSTCSDGILETTSHEVIEDSSIDVIGTTHTPMGDTDIQTEGTLKEKADIQIAVVQDPEHETKPTNESTVIETVAEETKHVAGEADVGVTENHAAGKAGVDIVTNVIASNELETETKLEVANDVKYVTEDKQHINPNVTVTKLEHTNRKEKEAVGAVEPIKNSHGRKLENLKADSLRVKTQKGTSHKSLTLEESKNEIKVTDSTKLEIRNTTNMRRVETHSSDESSEVKVVGTALDETSGGLEKHQLRQELLMGLLNSYYRRKPKRMGSQTELNRTEIKVTNTNSPGSTGDQSSHAKLKVSHSCSEVRESTSSISTKTKDSDLPKPIPKLKAIKIQEEIFESIPVSKVTSNTIETSYHSFSSVNKAGDNAYHQRSRTLPIRKSKTFSGLRDCERKELVKQRVVANDSESASHSSRKDSNTPSTPNTLSVPVKKRLKSPDTITRRQKLLSEIAEVEESKDELTFTHHHQRATPTTPRHTPSTRDTQRGQTPLTHGNKRRSLSLPTGTLAFGEARIVYKNGHFTFETMANSDLELDADPQTGTCGSSRDVSMRETSHNEEYSGKIINNKQRSYSSREVTSMHNKPLMRRQYGKATLGSTSSSHEDVFYNEVDESSVSPGNSVSPSNRCYSNHSDFSSLGSPLRDVFNDSSSSRTSINSAGSSISDRMDLGTDTESLSDSPKMTGPGCPEVKEDDVRRVMQRAKRTSSFRQAQEVGALRLSGIQEDRIHHSSRSRSESVDAIRNTKTDANKSPGVQNQNSSTFIKKMMAKRKSVNENLGVTKPGESAKEFFSKKMTLKGLFKKNKSDPAMIIGSPIRSDQSTPSTPSTPPIAAFSCDDDIDSIDTPPSSPYSNRDFRRRHTSADIYNSKHLPDTSETDSNCPTPTQERSSLLRHSISNPSTPIHGGTDDAFMNLRSSGSRGNSSSRGNVSRGTCEDDDISVASMSSVTSSVTSANTPHSSPLEQPNKPKTPKPVGASPRRNPSYGSQLSRLGSQSSYRTTQNSVSSLESDMLGDFDMHCECDQRRSATLGHRRKTSPDIVPTLEGSLDSLNSLNMCQYCKLMLYSEGLAGFSAKSVEKLRKHSYSREYTRQGSDLGKSRKDSTGQSVLERLGISAQTDGASSNSNDSGIQRDASIHSSSESIKASGEGCVRLRRNKSLSPRPDRPKSEIGVRWADSGDSESQDTPVNMRHKPRERPRPKSDLEDNIQLFDLLFEEVLEEIDTEGSSLLCDRMKVYGSEVNLQPYCSLRNLYEMRRRDLDRQKNRRMSTPHPIKSRLQRSPRKLNKHLPLMRSNSMPECLEKLHKRRKMHHLLDFHMDSVSRHLDNDECLSDDSEFSYDQTSLQEKSMSVRSSTSQLTNMDEDDENLTFAEALWDHITMDPEELGFRAQDVIEVLDMSDKDWWFGVIEDREGWFPAAFVRMRVNQEQYEEDLECTLMDNLTASPKLRRISMLSKNQARSNVVNEIICAEREYVKHLKDVVEGYIQHARKRVEMFPEERIQLIFGNLETIYKFAVKFVSQLEMCIDVCPHLSEIGQCFLDNERGFEIYSDYCNNHPSACEELKDLCKDSKYKHFFEACRLLQELVEIPLEGFLLTPVQKICKYPLQLAELLKYTPPEHPDYEKVKDALGAMRKIATLINERKRKMESIEKIAAWQHSVVDWAGPDLLENSSELIFSGDLNKINSAGWSQERYFFLFDHQLIYCKKELLKRHVFSYKGRIDLDNCDIIDVVDGKDSQYNVTVKHAWKFHETLKDKWYLVYAKSAQVKERWLKAIQDQRQCVLQDQENDFCVPDHWKQTVLNKVRSQSNIKENKSSGRLLQAQLSLQKDYKDFAYSTLPRHRLSTSAGSQKHDKKKGWFKFVSGKKSKR